MNRVDSPTTTPASSASPASPQSPPNKKSGLRHREDYKGPAQTIETLLDPRIQQGNSASDLTALDSADTNREPALPPNIQRTLLDLHCFPGEDSAFDGAPYTTPDHTESNSNEDPGFDTPMKTPLRSNRTAQLTAQFNTTLNGPDGLAPSARPFFGTPLTAPKTAPHPPQSEPRVTRSRLGVRALFQQTGKAASSLNTTSNHESKRHSPEAPQQRRVSISTAYSQSDAAVRRASISSSISGESLKEFFVERIGKSNLSDAVAAEFAESGRSATLRPSTKITNLLTELKAQHPELNLTVKSTDIHHKTDVLGFCPFDAQFCKQAEKHGQENFANVEALELAVRQFNHEKRAAITDGQALPQAFPATLTEIELNAFIDASVLQSVNIPSQTPSERFYTYNPSFDDSAKST